MIVDEKKRETRLAACLSEWLNSEATDFFGNRNQIGSRRTNTDLNPREIAAMQKPDAGDLLAREGWNSASVFAKLPESTKDEIASYLARIVPGVSGVDSKVLGSQET